MTARRLIGLVSAALGVLLGGCVVMPKTVERRSVVRVSVHEQPENDGFVTARIGTAGKHIAIALVRERSCLRTTTTVIETTREKELSVNTNSPGRLGNDPISSFIGFTWVVGSMITGPISLAYTVGALIDDEPTSQIEHVRSPVEDVDCSLALANRRVELTFPRGSVIRAVTDRRGEARVEVPASERGRGVLLIRAGSLSQRHQYAPAPPSPSEIAAARCAAWRRAPHAARAPADKLALVDRRPEGC